MTVLTEGYQSYSDERAKPYSAAEQLSMAGDIARNYSFETAVSWLENDAPTAMTRDVIDGFTDGIVDGLVADWKRGFATGAAERSAGIRSWVSGESAVRFADDESRTALLTRTCDRLFEHYDDAVSRQSPASQHLAGCIKQCMSELLQSQRNEAAARHGIAQPDDIYLEHLFGSVMRIQDGAVTSKGDGRLERAEDILRAVVGNDVEVTVDVFPAKPHPKTAPRSSVTEEPTVVVTAASENSPAHGSFTRKVVITGTALAVAAGGVMATAEAAHAADGQGTQPVPTVAEGASQSATKAIKLDAPVIIAAPKAAPAEAADPAPPVTVDAPPVAPDTATTIVSPGQDPAPATGASDTLPTQPTGAEATDSAANQPTDGPVIIGASNQNQAVVPVASADTASTPTVPNETTPNSNNDDPTQAVAPQQDSVPSAAADQPAVDSSSASTVPQQPASPATPEATTVAQANLTYADVKQLAAESSDDLVPTLQRYVADTYGESAQSVDGSAVQQVQNTILANLATAAPEHLATFNEANALAKLFADYPDLVSRQDPIISDLLTDVLGDLNQYPLSSDTAVKDISSQLEAAGLDSAMDSSTKQALIDVLADAQVQLTVAPAAADVSDLVLRTAAAPVVVSDTNHVSKGPIVLKLPEEHHARHHEAKHHNQHTEHRKHTPQNEHDRTGRFSELLSVIARFEGGNNYNAYYAHGDNTSIDFTSMTIGQVINWQSQYLAHGSPSSAIGKYQFLQATLKSLVGQYNIPLGTKFDKALQDRLAIHLLQKRGLDGYLSGHISSAQFAHNLSMEWASLPSVTGPHPESSYYAHDGLNHSFVSVKELMHAVHSIKPKRDHDDNGHHEHKIAHEQHHGLFITTGELPQADQVVRRARQFTHLSPSGLDEICGSTESCYQRCARLAARAWGYFNAGYGSAAEQWDAMKAKGEAHSGSRHLPVGALLFYNTGHEYGHVAVYLGHGQVLTNDVKDAYTGQGGAYITEANNLEGADWNLVYLGWSKPDYYTSRVSSWHPASSQQGSSSNDKGNHAKQPKHAPVPQPDPTPAGPVVVQPDQPMPTTPAPDSSSPAPDPTTPAPAASTPTPPPPTVVNAAPEQPTTVNTDGSATATPQQPDASSNQSNSDGPHSVIDGILSAVGLGD